MTWGKWMVVEFTVEEELRLETQCRSAYNCTDLQQLAHLCSSLVRQNAYYTKLVKQATGHIAEIEMIALFSQEVQVENLSEPKGDDIQVRNPFLNILLIILGIVMELGEFCFDLLRRVMPAKTPENHD